MGICFLKTKLRPQLCQNRSIQKWESNEMEIERYEIHFDGKTGREHIRLDFA